MIGMTFLRNDSAWVYSRFTHSELTALGESTTMKKSLEFDRGWNQAQPVIAAAQIRDVPPDVVASLFQIPGEPADEGDILARITDENLRHRIQTFTN